MTIFMKVCTALLFSALSFGAYAQNNEDPGNPGQNPSPEEIVIDAANTPEVIQALYVSNTIEIKAATLAKDKNPDEALGQYADQLIRDHKWINSVLELIANVKSVSLKSEELSANVQQLEKAKNAEVEVLAQKTDAEFRAAFLESAVKDHQAALQFLAEIEEKNTDDALKLTVAVYRQIVEKHLADAQKLQVPVEQPQ